MRRDYTDTLWNDLSEKEKRQMLYVAEIAPEENDGPLQTVIFPNCAFAIKGKKEGSHIVIDDQAMFYRRG